MIIVPTKLSDDIVDLRVIQDLSRGRKFGTSVVVTISFSLHPVIVHHGSEVVASWECTH